MSKKILVIDDDPVATRLMEYVLGQRGYQVLTAPNGLDGLRRAQNEGPNLIVLDIMLPGMDGFEVCHRLRLEDRTAKLPVLILSGRAQPIDKATGFKMGADDYMAKPATPSEIIDRIETLLARKIVSNPKILAFLSPKANVGTTTTAANIAVALSQMGKRVIAIDLCPYDGSLSQRLRVKPQDSVCFLKAPVDNVKDDDIESALIVHPTGVRVLRILEKEAQPTSTDPSNMDSLFSRLGEAADYILVDLPFKPTPTTRSVLTQCKLVVVASDYTFEALVGVKSVITTLRFLGMSSARIATVLIEPMGTLPDIALATVKPYIEANLGVTLLGVIPYDVDSSAGFSPDMGTQILSTPESPMANAVRGLAQQFIAMEQEYSSTARVRQ